MSETAWQPPGKDSLTWQPPQTDEPIGPDVEKKGHFVDDLLRQLGLTARYAIEGGLGLADLAAEPLRMAGNAIRPGTFTATGGQEIANQIGLPQPQPGVEAVVGDFSRSLAGAGGTIAGANALAGRVGPAAATAAKWLAANPSLQAQAAIGAGGGAAAARAAHLGPYGTMAAQLAGGLAVPGAIRGVRAAAEPLMDIGATIGAASGSKRGVTRLATDAIGRGLKTKQNVDAVRTAAYNATEFVPGAKPTMGEAIAEFNMKPAVAGPEKVTGGWLARLEKDLTGARGVEDVLPSNTKRVMKAIEAAKDRLDVETAALRDPVLDAVNSKSGGIETQRLLSNLDDLAANPEIKGDAAMARAVQIAQRTARRLDSGGKIDAKAIYSTRKTFNKSVAKAAEATEGTISAKDAKKMGWITHQVQLAIDDAIENSANSAGIGKQWATYLDKYSKGMRLIDSHVGRTEFSAEMAKGVKPLGSNVVPGEIPHPPTLLNRKMMFANWGLRLLGADANAPVVEEITRRLQDPKAFAELLQRPPKDPMRVWAEEAMRRGAQAAGMGLVANSDALQDNQ